MDVVTLWRAAAEIFGEREWRGRWCEDRGKAETQARRWDDDEHEVTAVWLERLVGEPEPVALRLDEEEATT